MRAFRIPYDMRREEKIFGGDLSLRQVIYLVICFFILLLSFLKIFLFIKAIIIPIAIIIMLMCAFYKHKEQNFDSYLFYAIKFITRKKLYVYER